MPNQADVIVNVRHVESHKAPLFMAHGLQCDPTFGNLLAKALPGDQPIYAFKGRGLDGSCEPLCSIEAMAEAYLAASAEIIRGRTVLLAGFCAGGHIAIEMARRISDVGGTVKRVLLVDTPRSQVAEKLDALIKEQVAVAEARRFRHPEIAKDMPAAPAVVAAYGRALQTFKARYYEGAVTIFGNQTLWPLLMDETLGWPGYLPASTRTVIVAESRRDLLVGGPRKMAPYINHMAATP